MSRAVAASRTLASNRTAASGRWGDLGITKSLHLYGSSSPSYVDFGNQTFLDGTPFTICQRLWVTSASMAFDGAIMSYGYDLGTSKGYAIRANGSNRKIQIFYSGGTNTSPTNFILAGKQMVFIEFDGVNSVRVFDGTTLTDSMSAVMSPNVSHVTNHCFIGARDTGGRYFEGVLGDGAWYNRILTDAERASITNFAIYPSSGRQVYFKFNDENSTITDHSGNGRNGTLTSGFWRNSPFNA